MVDIDLASFSFDTSDIVKGAAEIKKSIDEIKKSQKELDTSTDEGSEAFVKNAADLKTLNGYYREHIKYLSESSKSAFDAATREEQLNLVLGQETTTIKDLREQNKLLNKLRNDTNILTDEGQAELKLLNDQLDANNALIKENVDQYTQQKINIGNYASALEGVTGQIRIFGVSLSDVQSKLDGIKVAFTLVKDSVTDAASEMNTATKATKGMDAANKAAFISTQALSSGLKILKVALISTGIGAIVVAFGSLIAYLSSTQAGIDAITKVTRPLTAVFQTLLGIFQKLGGELFNKPLESLKTIYNFVKKQLVESFTGLGKIISGLFTFDADKIKEGANQIKKLADDNANALKGFAEGIGNQFAEAYQKGLKVDALQKQLERNQINNTIALGVATEEFKAQNKIAEDTNKTLAEREAAVKESILAAEKINALKQSDLDLEIEILKTKQSYNDTSREEEQQLADLIAKKNELNAQELEQTTTQQNKLNTIRREANAKALAEQQKQTDESLKKDKERIELFEQEMKGFKSQTLQEELEAEQAISDMKLALLQRELDAKKLSQEQYAREVLAISQDLARLEAEVKVEAAQREVEAYRNAFEKQLEDRQFLSDEVLVKKTNELNALLEQEQAFAALQFEQGLLNKQDYDDAIFQLGEENRLAIAEITAEREAVEKEEAAELRALAFEEELARLTEQNATKFELEQAQVAQKYANDKLALDASLKNQEISQELYNSKLESLTRQRATAEASIETQLRDQKLALTGGLLSQLSGLIDKQSAAGKAIAVAQAGINTFQGITEGLKAPFPLNIAMPILAGITGLAATKKIISTKVPSASGGGSVGGGGGGGFSANFASNLSSNAPLSSTNANVQDQVETTANQTDTTSGIADAVQQGAEAGTQQGSQTGITNLSDNRQIMNESSF